MIHFWRRVLFTAAALLVTLSCSAQRQQAQRLVQEGDLLLEQDDPEGAVKRFTEAIRADRTYAPAHVRLGMLELGSGSLGSAESHFSRALNSDPNNLEAHYYQGIVKREQGRLRPPLTGWLLAEWRDSRRHFNFVIDRDSTFASVLYQLALLYQYRGDEAGAMELAYRQVALKPDDPEAQSGFFRMGRMYSSTARGSADTWLAPVSNEYAEVLRAEILRREGSLDQSEAALLRVQQTISEVRRPIVHLLLARIYAARGQDLGAQVQFWSAVDAVQSSGEAALVFDEVKYVLDDDEIRLYRRIGELEEYRRFFRSVWTRRDPLPAAAANVRLIEHLRRLNEAERSFEYFRPRTWFNDPDVRHRLQFDEVYVLNHQFNDRGLIFIRHGYPDERLFTSGEEGGSLSMFSAADASGERSGGGGLGTMEPMAIESWRYRADDQLPEMVFHFASRAGANWRIVAAPLFPQALYDRRGWNHIYHETYRALTERNDVDVPRLINQMQRESQQAVTTALRTDRHTWATGIRELPLPASIVAFRGEDRSTEVEVFYVFPTSPIAEYTASEANVPVEIGLALLDRDWNDVVVRRDRKLVSPSTNLSDAAIGRFQFTVEPDSYLVSLHVRPEGTPLVGGWRSWRNFADFSSGHLEMSDVLLATSISSATESSPFRRGALDVVPSFTRRFSASSPVYIYLEVYNLALDSSERTSYEMEIELRPKNPPRRGPLGLFGRDRRPVLTLRTASGGEEVSPVEHFEIDMSDVSHGDYTLVVRVHDSISGSVSERQQELELIE